MMAKTTTQQGKRPAKQPKTQPRIKPPGVILSGEASETGSVRAAIEPGSMRLRSMLELSDKCSLDQVCEDAANEIARLRLIKHNR